jgi:hypothetical protein
MIVFLLFVVFVRFGFDYLILIIELIFVRACVCSIRVLCRILIRNLFMF